MSFFKDAQQLVKLLKKSATCHKHSILSGFAKETAPYLRGMPLESQYYIMEGMNIRIRRVNALYKVPSRVWMVISKHNQLMRSSDVNQQDRAVHFARAGDICIEFDGAAVDDLH